MTKYLLSLALFVLLFANAEAGSAMLFQLGGIGIITMMASVAVLREGIDRKPLSLFETVMLIAASLSMAISIFSEVEYTSLYSLTFLYVICLAIVVARTVTLSDILSGATYSYLAMISACFLLTRQEMFDALNISLDNRWALRYAPFGLHPNLAGFIFGGGVAVLITQALVSTGKNRLLFAGASLLSLQIVMASSSRASFLALALAVAIASLANLKRIGAKVIGGTIALAFIVVLLKTQSLFDYLSEIFELSSEQRGIGSGGSGRLELWQMALDRLFSDPIQLFLGGGLRSSSYELLGFNTENSYLTIMLDSGILVGTVLIFSICRLISRLWRQIRAPQGREWRLYTGVLMLITYTVAESVFNRYLIAIGNPLSVLFLLLCAKTELVTQHNSQEVNDYKEMIEIRSPF
ncbi:O-antigen ligase family protein [Methylocystis echinoides]|uniref:O-antigen ligase family protein n=1 Tax=Methylocystis echinoides TaxID=29468 RepID=UPI0034197396